MTWQQILTDLLKLAAAVGAVGVVGGGIHRWIWKPIVGTWARVEAFIQQAESNADAVIEGLEGMQRTLSIYEGSRDDRLATMAAKVAGLDQWRVEHKREHERISLDLLNVMKQANQLDRRDGEGEPG